MFPLLPQSEDGSLHRRVVSPDPRDDVQLPGLRLLPGGGPGVQEAEIFPGANTHIRDEHSGQHLRVLPLHSPQVHLHPPLQPRPVFSQCVADVLRQAQHLQRSDDVPAGQVPRPPPPRLIQGESHSVGSQGSDTLNNFHTFFSFKFLH